MAGEMHWIYFAGMGILGALLLLFPDSRVAVPVRQKYRRGARK